MLSPVLTMVLGLLGDGDPEPTTLILSVARPTRAEDGGVSFDLQAQLPSSLKATKLSEVATKCVPSLTLPDGSTPKLKFAVTSTSGNAITAHLEVLTPIPPGPSQWKLTLTCPTIDSGPPQTFGVFGTAPNAWMVIVFGAKTRAESETWIEAHRYNGLLTHNSFPLLLDSQWVLGLTPGFFVVVLAAADDKEVANTLAREFGRQFGEVGRSGRLLRLL